MYAKKYFAKAAPVSGARNVNYMKILKGWKIPLPDQRM
jgi:hypothetical protein